MAGARIVSAVEKLEAIRGAAVIAVVGLQDNPARPAYGVARFLQARGKRILPVHPQGGSVLGETIHRSLADLPQRPDLVDVFRNPAHLPGLLDEVLALPEALRPRILWFQDGVVDEPTADRALAAGFRVVMDDCTARVLARA
ncbi:MAG: CoA-binding protein [Deltaproteobacteria bacterium]|nr:CoA-binding protein [Deltaproteobacteria bacterium]